ncbi:NAD(P)/FAD-dependent oxidoreductase [Mastigocoleus sp. MO_188.B34]|uniref:flavin monoamine oxidase family protein n=1 Tax=Mastigocoleus sp. MO_188.B34 TaxID=3036635 RepID=UPI0026339E6B|nr:NAD(P)/FAD-dependent oxidoreductase [Mastigocoleus sp. MO_188.B34]MDJ0697471.1 FAD-dependent oxidoreductase [Mastigocoleus sp. MO_188.B34]
MDIQKMLDMCRLRNHTTGKKILILGAGIAGLVAAYELERLGHTVEIIEASDRIGGRIWTYRFGDGEDAAYGELGAMRIPSDHEYTLHYVREMGLSDKLCKFVTVFEEQNALMNMEGKIFRIKDAPRVLQEQYQGIFKDEHYSEQTRFFAAWLQTIVNAISPESLRKSLERDLQSHLMDELEQLDLTPYFSEDGETIDLQNFIKENPSFRAKCSQDLDMFLSDILIETSHDLLQIAGGTEQIIDRLVASIKGNIKCNTEVTGLQICKSSVRVSLKENGEFYSRNCDYVLCTIPFSVLRELELVGFDRKKLESIHNTVYCPATKVAFNCAQRFWEKGGIRGGASFSGEGVRQTYYPSVKGNTTMLASYTIGDDADKIGAMLEQERYDYVKQVVGKIHPEIQQEGMVVDEASIAWGNYKWSAGGCTIRWDGDESKHTINYLEAARSQNTLFFAGEHCSRFPAWIQGSLESALEAVYDIVVHKPCLDKSLDDSCVLPVRTNSINTFAA